MRVTNINTNTFTNANTNANQIQIQLQILIQIQIQIQIQILRHIGLLEADEDKIRKIRPKGTLVTILYVPREAICPKGG